MVYWLKLVLGRTEWGCLPGELVGLTVKIDDFNCQPHLTEGVLVGNASRGFCLKLTVDITSSI